jgi:Flp pilus assembly pilin Flp
VSIALFADLNGGGRTHALFGFAQTHAYLVTRRLEPLRGERGQGTVEYVGLILLVSLLMVGMVVAMKGSITIGR